VHETIYQALYRPELGGLSRELPARALRTRRRRRRSLTWDQGKEMALHQQVTAALGLPVYFCDKASPWQRPSDENTSGLLRQYFPKGSDLRAHGPDELAAVAAELNARPRKTVGWDTPA